MIAKSKLSCLDLLHVVPFFNLWIVGNNGWMIAKSKLSSLDLGHVVHFFKFWIVGNNGWMIAKSKLSSLDLLHVLLFFKLYENKAIEKTKEMLNKVDGNNSVGSSLCHRSGKENLTWMTIKWLTTKIWK